MLIAGGGTGGHLFPGMAVAEEFLSRDPGHRVLFVGTARGVESRLVPEAGYEFASIRSKGLARMGVAGKVRGLAVLPLSLLDAGRVIRGFRPHVALGVGGYVSGPALLAARLLGVPCAIQEQNAVPGWANRILGRIVSVVFVSFEQARSWFGRASKKDRVVVSGNPVRRKIVSALGRVAEKGPIGKDAGKVAILVVGGSQGAHGLNLMVLDAVAELAADDRQRISIRHQSGKADLDMVGSRYTDLGMDAEVEPFIEDMADAYGKADLVISRAGAGAVSEIAIAGLPSILVPYPFAASDHQAANAGVLVEAGAALMFREKATGPGEFCEALRRIIADADRRRSMSARAKSAARPEAAAMIVDKCLELVACKG